MKLSPEQSTLTVLPTAMGRLGGKIPGGRWVRHLAVAAGHRGSAVSDERAAEMELEPRALVIQAAQSRRPSAAMPRTVSS